MTDSSYRTLAELILLRLEQTRFDSESDEWLNSFDEELCNVIDKLLLIPEVIQAVNRL